MLSNYLPDDICIIIQEKLSLDYKKYKFWCSNECKWIYVWTCDVIKCPNNKNHNLECIQTISHVKSNGKILLLDNTKIVDNVIQTEFEIINIIT